MVVQPETYGLEARFWTANEALTDARIVGSEEARLRAGLRPPLTLHVQISRMQRSRRLKSSEMPKKE
jgi:hypothetical protein